MFAAIAVTVQVAVLGRVESGVSVIALVPEPLTVKVSGVPVGHSIVNELVVTLTGSLKSTSMVADGSTAVAPSAGVLAVKIGALSVANEKT